MRLLSSLTVAAALAVSSAGAFAQSDQEVDARMDALFGAHEPYRAFFDRLKHAVAAGDKNAVAGMIAYPVTMRIGGKKIALRSKRDFVARYASIFTPKLVDIVAGQQYATLFVRDQGAMIGGGEIWFSGVCRDNACQKPDVKIIAFNL
jgi:hypothetical protein